jgi:tetratricopeptide (TPR) repeat protein
MAQQGFSSIGIKAGIAESIAADTTAAVVAWLEDLDNRWLLVLDDVHDINILSYLPRTGNGCVLITSKTEISRAASTTVKVNAFTPQQARQLLLRITKRPEPQGKESVIVDKLVQGLANLPLAVELVGASIKNKGISFEDYAASQNNERHMFGPRDKDTDFTGYSASLPETFDLTFELLSKSAPEVWPTARDLLYFFALLHPAGASTQIIEHTWLCMSRMINEGRLMVRPPSNWLRLLHPSQASEWENVLNTVQECLALLSKWSVLAFEGGANEHNVQIHSLVQKWIVQSMSSQEKRQWYATVATSLAVVWQHGKYNADLSPHLEHLASLFPNESIFDIPWSFAPQDDCAVASRWADIYSTSGYYNKAVQIRRTICNNVQASRKQGLSHLRLLAESWEKLAASWSDYGDHERALVAYVEAQRTAAPGYQKDKYLSRVYIRCIGYIGREYHISGENESALQKREEACRRWVDLGERLNSRDILEVDVFQAKRDFASSLIDIGKTQDAIKILERLIREKNQPVGINVINVEYEGDRSSDLDFDVLVTRSLLGHAYNEHRMHAQALEQHALVLRFQKQLSESHPDTLIAKENLAISYSSNGDHREAFRLRSEAIQQWAELKSQIPTSFRNLIAAKFNLAKSCEAMDYTERALEYYGEVLSFRLSAVEQRHDRLCKDPNCDTRRARDGKVILTCSHLLKEHHSSVQDAMETLEAIAFAKKKSNIATVGSDVEFLLRICNLKLKTGTPRSKRKALAFASRLASLSADVEEKIRRRKGILELQSHHLGGSDKDALDTALDIARNLHEAQRYKEADGYVSRVLHHQKVLKGAYPLFFEAARKLREQVLVEGTTRVSQSASNPEQTVSPHSSPRHIAVVSRPQPNLGQGGGQPVLIQQRAPADMQALEAILARMAPEPRPRAS